MELKIDFSHQRFDIPAYISVCLVQTRKWGAYEISLFISSLIRLLAICMTANAAYPGSVI